MEEVTYYQNILDLGSFIDLNHNSQGSTFRNLNCSSNTGQLFVLKPFDTIDQEN